MKSLLSLLLVCALATLGAYLAAEHVPLVHWLQPLFHELRQMGVPWLWQSVLWMLALAIPAGVVGGFLLSFYARLAGGIGFFPLLLAAAASILVLAPEQTQELLQSGLNDPRYALLVLTDLVARALLYRRFALSPAKAKERGAGKGRAERLARAQQLAAVLQERAGTSAEPQAAGQDALKAAERPRPRRRQKPLRREKPQRQKVAKRVSSRPHGWAIEKVRQTGPVGVERGWRS